MQGFEELPRVQWQTTRGPIRLLAPLVYWTASRRRIEVPEGMTSDLESRPMLLPGVVHYLLGSSNSTACAAIVHDFLYAKGPFMVPAVSRSEADAIYCEILAFCGYGLFSRNLAWAGLRIGGWVAWGRHRQRDPR